MLWEGGESELNSDRSSARNGGVSTPLWEGNPGGGIEPLLRQVWAAGTSRQPWLAAASAVGLLVPSVAVGIGFGWAMSLIRDLAPDFYQTVLGDWTPGGFGRWAFLVAVVVQLLASRAEKAAR